LSLAASVLYAPVIVGMIFSQHIIEGIVVMSHHYRFLLRVPFALAGLALLATGLIYLSAIGDVQTQLALAVVD